MQLLRGRQVAIQRADDNQDLKATISAALRQTAEGHRVPVGSHCFSQRHRGAALRQAQDVPLNPRVSGGLAKHSEGAPCHVTSCLSCLAA